MVLNSYEEISIQIIAKKKLIEPETGKTTFEKIYHIEKMIADNVLYMHSLTFRTSVMKKMGSVIDEHCFYVDMEYCVFPLLYVKSFAYLNYPVYQYLLGSQTQSMNMQNLIKRREQHMKVTKRLVEFYEENSDKVPENISNVMSLRINMRCTSNIKSILICQKKKLAKKLKSLTNG